MSYAFTIIYNGMPPDLYDLSFSTYHIPLLLHEKKLVGVAKVFSYHQQSRDHLPTKDIKKEKKKK